MADMDQSQNSFEPVFQTLEIKDREGVTGIRCGDYFMKVSNKCDASLSDFNLEDSWNAGLTLEGAKTQLPGTSSLTYDLALAE